jgi:small-conductance mechanosensitive channel
MVLAFGDRTFRIQTCIQEKLMEYLTHFLGFDARYVVYLIIALFVAAILRFGILKTLRRWAAKTESMLDDQIVDYLESLVTPLLLIAILYYLSYLLPIAAYLIQYIHKGLIIAVILLVAGFSARLVSSLLATLGNQRENWQRFLQPLRALSNVLLTLIAIALSLKVLEVSLSDEGTRLVRIIGIIVGAFVLLRIVNLAVIQMERMVQDSDPDTLSEAEKRAKTLGKIINSIGFVLVMGVTIMLILDEFGINIMPIITGAGIAGLAVGFGAQNLVRDVISGFFLILEDQIRVGDVARINGTGGTVEAIRLRTTILRDINGTVHIFPNGEIKAVANMTKEFSYYVINVGIAYKENVDLVMEVLKAIGTELEQDPEFGGFILDPLEILGVDDFENSQVTIKIRIKTKPLKQWVVGRELRRRIKNTFDSKGIVIPFPHLSVYFGEASKPPDISAQGQQGEELDRTPRK